MRRARRKLEVNTFPFLAVLLCAMGSFILLLLMVDQQGKIAAQNKARDEYLARKLAYESSRDAAVKNAKDQEAKHKAAWQMQKDKIHAELKAEEDALARQMTQLLAALAKADDQLHGQKSATTSTAERIAIENAALKALQKELASRQDHLQRTRQTTQGHLKLREQLTRDIAVLEAALRNVQDRKTSQRPVYSLVPYKGKHGASAKPIYIEVADGSVAVHPGPTTLTSATWSPEAFRRAIEERTGPLEKEVFRPGALPPDKSNNPYVLFLVRPSGIPLYYDSQNALRGYRVDFGYELVEPDWVFDFSDGKLDQQPWRNVARLDVEPSNVTRPAPKGIGPRNLSPFPGPGDIPTPGERGAFAPRGTESPGAAPSPFGVPGTIAPGVVGGATPGVTIGQPALGRPSLGGPGVIGGGPGNSTGVSVFGQPGDLAHPRNAGGGNPGGGFPSPSNLGGGGTPGGIPSLPGVKNGGPFAGQGALGGGSGDGQANVPQNSTGVPGGIRIAGPQDAVGNPSGTPGGRPSVPGGVPGAAGGQANGPATPGGSPGGQFNDGSPRSANGPPNGASPGGSNQPAGPYSGERPTGQFGGPGGTPGGSLARGGDVGGGSPGGSGAPGSGSGDPTQPNPGQGGSPPPGGAGSPQGSPGSGHSPGGAQGGAPGGGVPSLTLDLNDRKPDQPSGPRKDGSPSDSPLSFRNVPPTEKSNNEPGGNQPRPLFGGSSDPNAEQGPNFGPSPFVPLEKSRSGPRLPALGRIISNRDFVLTVECFERTVSLSPPGRTFDANDPRALEELAALMKTLVTRRQGTVRPGEPPYRPIVHFRVQPDGRRTYYDVYPRIAEFGYPMSRENPD